MPDVPARSPLQDLADAMRTLRRLHAEHSRHPVLKTLIDWIEAELTYLLDPTSRIIQSPKETRRK